MKKILSFLIILAVCISVIPMGYAAENYSNAEEFVMGMGIIENFEKDKVITRAEFAVILAELCGLNDENAAQKEWLESNYTEEKNETAVIDTENRRFYDIDSSHPYYSQILAVCNSGYMSGVSENLFAPEYNLAMKDAVKTFIDMLGYAQMYKQNQSTAVSIGLLKGINSSMERPATMGDVANLIYNSLDITVIELKVTGSENAGYYNSEETFMRAVLDMDRVKGVMTDNGKTSFSGESSIAEDEVLVGNIIAKVTGKTEYARSFIGHYVEMYYRIKDDENEVLYVNIDHRDNAVTFDIKDFDSYEDNSISYLENDRVVRKSLDSNLYMIYNGEAKTVFDKSIFEFESGNVTITATEGSEYNFIIVNSYEFAVVRSVNLRESIIYSKIKNSEKNYPDTLNCETGKEYDKVLIKNIDGEELTLSDLAENDVLNIIRSSKTLNITVSKAKEEYFKIAGMGRDEAGRQVVSNAEKQYTVSEYYENGKDKTGLILGNTYTVYLNMFDKIVWVQKAQSSDSIGILTRIVYSEDEGDEPLRMIKMYTADGKISSFHSGEKLKINNVNKKFEVIENELEDFLGIPVLYSVNDEGIITKLTTPEKFGEFGDRGWYEIAPEGEYQYYANDNDLSRMMYYVKGKTTVFTVPEDKELYNDEKQFSVNTKVFSDNETGIKAIGYSQDKFSVIPDVITIKQKAVVGEAATADNIMIIEAFEQGLNAEDEPVTIITGKQFSNKTITQKTLVVNSDCVMVNRTGGQVDQSDKTTVSEVGPKTVSELEAGDIIRYKVNVMNEAISIRIAYDCDTKKAFSSGAGADDNAGGTTVAGYAYTRSGESVRITKTTSILPSSVDLKNISSVKNNLYAFKVNCPDAILVVKEGKNGKKEIYQGTLDDLRAYYDTNKNSESDILVINAHWSSAMRGAVIYK